MEDHWISRAQSAEAQLATMKDAYGPALERVKQFKENFGVRERSNGEIVIDFDKLVERLGAKNALELRAIIDAAYNISGEPGEKPHMRLEVQEEMAV